MATEEADDAHAELVEVLDEVEHGIKALEKLKGEAKTKKAHELADRLKYTKQQFTSYKVELQELPKPTRARYDAKTKDAEARIQKLQSDLSWAKSDAERADLMDGPASTEKNIDDMTGGEIIAKAEGIQAASRASTGRSKEKIQQALQIGGATLQTMHEQTDQIRRITDDVDTVNANLVRADKQLKDFMKRMMTDKCILALVVLIACAVLGVIIYSQVGGSKAESATNVPDLSTVTRY